MALQPSRTQRKITIARLSMTRSTILSQSRCILTVKMVARSSQLRMARPALTVVFVTLSLDRKSPKKMPARNPSLSLRKRRKQETRDSRRLPSRTPLHSRCRAACLARLSKRLRMRRPSARRLRRLLNMPKRVSMQRSSTRTVTSSSKKQRQSSFCICPRKSSLRRPLVIATMRRLPQSMRPSSATRPSLRTRRALTTTPSAVLKQ